MPVKLWVVVPAAGVGKRMGLDIPKQYIQVLGKSILEHSLNKLVQISSETILLALDVNDGYFSDLPLFSTVQEKVQRVNGGEERSDSVMNCLLALKEKAAADDWVLVHDVARPCVDVESIRGLLDFLNKNNITTGGILASPVTSTFKQVQCVDKVLTVEKTLDRSQIFEAQTPQIFRFSVLLRAMEKAQENNLSVTDEAMAVESAGLDVYVFEGSKNNIKLTHSEDLKFIECILKEQL